LGYNIESLLINNVILTYSDHTLIFLPLPDLGLDNPNLLQDNSNHFLIFAILFYAEHLLSIEQMTNQPVLQYNRKDKNECPASDPVEEGNE